MGGTRQAREGARRLARLFHYRWAAAVLAELHRRRGARAAALVHRLGAPRDTVRRTLEGLAAMGLARRNPGYGHPLRPEWILTAAGERLAPRCGGLLRGIGDARMEEAARRKWAFPILLALLDGRDRFSAIGSVIPGVTARALAQTLRELEGAGVVRRRVVDDRPPRVVYTASRSGRRLGPALRALANVA